MPRRDDKPLLYAIEEHRKANPGMTWMAAYRDVCELPDAESTDTAVERLRRKRSRLKKAGKFPQDRPVPEEFQREFSELVDGRELALQQVLKALSDAEATCKALGIEWDASEGLYLLLRKLEARRHELRAITDTSPDLAAAKAVEKGVQTLEDANRLYLEYAAERDWIELRINAIERYRRLRVTLQDLS